MAGKEQHHIWQMIQRGFGTKNRKNHEIWVYTKENQPRKTVTKNFGFENYFLSEKGNNSADETLTSFEHSIQSKLQEAKRASDGTPLETDFMAPIVSHFEMRSLFFRNEASRMTKRAVQAFEDLISSEDQAKQLLRDYLKANPNLLDEEFNKRSVSPQDRNLAYLYLEQFAPELINKGAGQIPDEFRTAFSLFKDKIADMVKSAHIRGVSSGFTDIERTKHHAKFSYRVRKFDAPLILPDTGVVFMKRKGVSPLTQKNDQITDILIPLDTYTLIHGYKKVMTIVDRQTTLRMFASCSYQAFIAQDEQAEFSKLTRLIGKNARMLTDLEIRQAISFKSILGGIEKN